MNEWTNEWMNEYLQSTTSFVYVCIFSAIILLNMLLLYYHGNKRVRPPAIHPIAQCTIKANYIWTLRCGYLNECSSLCSYNFAGSYKDPEAVNMVADIDIATVTICLGLLAKGCHSKEVNGRSNTDALKWWGYKWKWRCWQCCCCCCCYCGCGFIGFL